MSSESERCEHGERSGHSALYVAHIFLDSCASIHLQKNRRRYPTEGTMKKLAYGCWDTLKKRFCFLKTATWLIWQGRVMVCWKGRVFVVAVWFFVLFCFTKWFSETWRLNLLTLTLVTAFSSVIPFPLPLALLFSLEVSFCETLGGKLWMHEEGKVMDELAPSVMSIEMRLTLWMGLGQCGDLDIQIHSLPLEITCV